MLISATVMQSDCWVHTGMHWMRVGRAGRLQVTGDGDSRAWLLRWLSVPSAQTHLQWNQGRDGTSSTQWMPTQPKCDQRWHCSHTSGRLWNATGATPEPSAKLGPAGKLPTGPTLSAATPGFPAASVAAEPCAEALLEFEFEFSLLPPGAVRRRALRAALSACAASRRCLSSSAAGTRNWRSPQWGQGLGNRPLCSCRQRAQVQSSMWGGGGKAGRGVQNAKT